LRMLLVQLRIAPKIPKTPTCIDSYFIVKVYF